MVMMHKTPHALTLPTVLLEETTTPRRKATTRHADVLAPERAKAGDDKEHEVLRDNCSQERYGAEPDEQDSRQHR